MRLIDADKLVWRTQLRLDRTMLDVDFVFKEDIDAMPTIEAEPVRHGHWKHDRDSIQIDGYCSCCGFINIFMPKRNFADMPYCPNCGAKMDEE